MDDLKQDLINQIAIEHYCSVGPFEQMFREDLLKALLEWKKRPFYRRLWGKDEFLIERMKEYDKERAKKAKPISFPKFKFKQG